MQQDVRAAAFPIQGAPPLRTSDWLQKPSGTARRTAEPGQRVLRLSVHDGLMTGSADTATRGNRPAARACDTLFIVDWDAGAAEQLQQQLNSLAGPQAPESASAVWQVLNCPSSEVQAGQGHGSLAQGLQTLRYLGTAARAAWRSRHHAQVVVWRQAIGYLLCVLPKWPGWLCASGRRPRLIMTTVLLSPSSTAPWSWKRLLLELALRRADALVYFSRDTALDTARRRPAQAHKVFWMPLPQFGEPAGQDLRAAAPQGEPANWAIDQPDALHGPLARASFNLPARAPAPLSVFAGGTSDRDFDVVVEAFRDRNVPVTIVCREDQRFRPPGPVGAHCSVRRGVSETEFHALAAAAGVVVVALKSSASACGQLLFGFCMRHGIPVIATDCYGTRDEVIHGHTGWLIPAGDARALTQAYDCLAADAALRQQLVRNARAQALARAHASGLAGFVQTMQALGETLEGCPTAAAPASALALLKPAALESTEDQLTRPQPDVHAPRGACSAGGAN